jgi:tetratricopeptide (TPR) repeat protein
MARSLGSKPVEIVYYPKKARRGTAPRRLQTVETSVTEEVVELPAERRPRGRMTLTDETVDPSEQAFAELTRLGHEAFEAGRAEEARVVFESLVALGRRDPFAHTMLGTILLGAQALDKALEQFEAALEIDPEDLAALVYRGEIRLSRRKVSRAMEDLERAIKLGASTDPFVARAKKLLALARNRPA